jgi:uncharacterized protein (TIGR02757 family)
MAMRAAKDEKLRVPDDLRDFLLEKAALYERPDFIPNDPIAVPHRFSDKADIELAGFIAAILAWGQRKTILASAGVFMDRLDGAPGDFMKHATAADIRTAAKGFVHRTFQPRDAELFLHALQALTHAHGGLESAFVPEGTNHDAEACLTAFHARFFEAAAQRGYAADRTRKHVATPARGSAAKRLNMFLRWMVRPSRRGVDFGIWNQIAPSQLMVPLDVHTGNVGRKLGLLDRKQNDWKAVELLTAALRQVDPDDPVRLDFALFGLGAIEQF